MPPTVTLDAPHSAGQLLPFRQSLMAMLGMCFVIMLVAVDQTVVGAARPLVNGQAVAADPVHLKSGDLIELAGTQMQFVQA